MGELAWGKPWQGVEERRQSLSSHSCISPPKALACPASSSSHWWSGKDGFHLSWGARDPPHPTQSSGQGDTLGSRAAWYIDSPSPSNASSCGQRCPALSPFPSAETWKLIAGVAGAAPSRCLSHGDGVGANSVQLGRALPAGDTALCAHGCKWAQGLTPAKYSLGGVAWVWVSPDGLFSCPCSCRASVSLSIKWASCPGAFRCFETACRDVACARHLPRDKAQLSVTQGSPGAGVALSLPPQVPQEPRGHGQRPLPGASPSPYATAETQRTRCTSESPCFPRWGQTQSHFLSTSQFILSSQALPGRAGGVSERHPLPGLPPHQEQLQVKGEVWGHPVPTPGHRDATSTLRCQEFQLHRWSRDGCWMLLLGCQHHPWVLEGSRQAGIWGGCAGHT